MREGGFGEGQRDESLTMMMIVTNTTTSNVERTHSTQGLLLVAFVMVSIAIPLTAAGHLLSSIV